MLSLSISAIYWLALTFMRPFPGLRLAKEAVVYPSAHARMAGLGPALPPFMGLTPPASPGINGSVPVPAIDKSVILSQTALFVGAIISTVACVSVVFQYCRYKSVRRPPLSLLFWRTVADLLFSLQYIFTFSVQRTIKDDTFWGTHAEYRSLCSAVAFYTQFTAFASEMWLAMICLDLALSLTQPFRPVSSYSPRYHATVWLSSLATATFLLAFDLQGPSAIHICWVNTSETKAAIMPDANCSASTAWSLSMQWDRETWANW